MIVGSTNIWTYKFLVSEINGLFNLPARKQTTEIYGTDAKDIQHRNKNVTIILVAKYYSTANLKTNTEGLKTLVSGGEKTFTLSDYSRTFKGIVNGGVNIEILGLAVKAKINITVTEIIS
jgi:hypothetical protein